MMLTSLDRVMQLAGAHVLNSVFEGLLVALFASALLAVISSRSSGTRFAVWFCSLLAVVGLAVDVFLAPSHTLPLGQGPHLTFPAFWAEYTFAAWAVIAAAGLIRVCVGLKKVSRLRRNCTPAPAEILDIPFSELVQQVGCRRSVELCISDELRVPTAMGFLRPAVVLPCWVSEEFPPSELRSVVLHELGHLRRYDDWTNLAQKIVRAMLFFHPAVWWIDSRLTLEREMACDDLVLARTGNARGYAECLVALAEKAAARSGIALALAAVSRMKQTAARLSRILERNRLVDTGMSSASVFAIAVFSAAALIALPHTPALVAFQSTTTVSTTGTRARPVAPAVGRPAAIPAAYRETDSSPRVLPAVMSTSAPTEGLKTNQRARHSKLNRTLHPSRRIAPRVVRTSFKDKEQAAPTLVLVVEAEQEADGFANVWTICVWHTGANPDLGLVKATVVQKETTSKAI